MVVVAYAWRVGCDGEMHDVLVVIVITEAVMNITV